MSGCFWPEAAASRLIYSATGTDPKQTLLVSNGDAMPALIRVFRASVKPGLAAEFQSFFLEEALPLVRSQEGLQKATVGLPCNGKPNEFLMISEWDSLESLKRFAGEDWNRAVIDPREAHLLVETSVDHYYQYES